MLAAFISDLLIKLSLLLGNPYFSCIFPFKPNLKLWSCFTLCLFVVSVLVISLAHYIPVAFDSFFSTEVLYLLIPDLFIYALLGKGLLLSKSTSYNLPLATFLMTNSQSALNRWSTRSKLALMNSRILRTLC